MRSQKFFIFFATLILGVVAQANIINIKVPNGSDIKLTHPDNWEVAQAPSDLSPRVKFYSDKKQRTVLLLSFFEDKNGHLKNQKDVEKDVLNEANRQYVANSAEKKANVKKLSSKNLLGAYANFSDANLVNEKSVTPPKYKYATMGILLIGKTVATFTFLSNLANDSANNEAFKFLATGITKK